MDKKLAGEALKELQDQVCDKGKAALEKLARAMDITLHKKIFDVKCGQIYSKSNSEKGMIVCYSHDRYQFINIRNGNRWNNYNTSLHHITAYLIEGNWKLYTGIFELKEIK